MFSTIERDKINGLDLFAGIGGISLALQPWVRTVCYVEIDPYCQAVLQARINSGDIASAPIWDDITTFDPEPWIGAVDIISGGFPCQDISVAGNGAGLEGTRSSLFWEIPRIVGKIRPTFVYLENTPAITKRGGKDVVGALAALGYDCRWGVLSAYDVGAPHKRERWWCLAHTDERGCGASNKRDPVNGGITAPVCERRQPLNKSRDNGGFRDVAGTSEREIKPRVDRTGDDIPARVDRLRGLGNSVVPQCAREAFKRLLVMK